MIIPQPSDARTTRRFAWLLLAFTIAALVLRIAYVVAHRGDIVGGDGWWYQASAAVAANGKWFEWPAVGGGPDAHHPPIWTAMLSLVAWLGGNDQLTLQVFATLVGAAAIPLIGLAGRRIAGERVGLLAAGLAAIYPGLWQYDRELLSEVVLMPLVALVLLLVYRYRDRPSIWRAVALSMACAALCLARSEQVALFVLVVLPLLLRTRSIDLRRRLAALGAAALTAVLVLTPWTVFNLARFDNPVVLSTGLGSTMSAGACEATFSGSLIGNFSTICNYERLPLTQGLDRSEIDVKLRRVALDYTFDHAGEIPAVTAARLGRTFGLYRPVQEIRLASEWSLSPQWVGWAWTIGYTVLVPFAVAGAVLLRRRRTIIYPLLAEFVIVAVAAATTFGQIRYRAAAEVPLLVLASVALDWIWCRWRSRRSTEERSDDLEGAELAVAP